jgi:hypothetical protein
LIKLLVIFDAASDPVKFLTWFEAIFATVGRAAITIDFVILLFSISLKLKPDPVSS